MQHTEVCYHRHAEIVNVRVVSGLSKELYFNGAVGPLEFGKPPLAKGHYRHAS